MQGRPRVDLDGLALADERDETMVLVVFRYRTREGLVLLIPESGDFLVPWSEVVSADLDLASGRVRVQFDAAFTTRSHWLRGATALVGQWVDRFELDAASIL